MEGETKDFSDRSDSNVDFSDEVSEMVGGKLRALPMEFISKMVGNSGIMSLSLPLDSTVDTVGG